jgi:putative ABC transport system permease protein
VAADTGLMTALREGSAQAGESRQRQRLRAGLVVAQVAVSFVLLVGAGLMIQSLWRIASVPLGYRSANVLTAAYFGNFSRMNTTAEAHRVQARILETLRATPGVRAAALTNAVPQASVTPGQVIVTIEGRPAADGLRLEADPNVASDGYFDLLDVKRLGGRDFQAGDTLDAPRVAIVNRTMAAFWGGGDPIGGRFTVGPPQNRVTRTVIGVVEDFRLYGASERAVEPQFYVPYTQVGGPIGRLLVRSHDGGGPMAAAIRAAVHGADAQLPVEEVRTLDQLRRERLTSPGVTTALLALFAALALVITLAGLAGLVSTSVSQRTREFGLRMALGASRGAVLRMVLGQGTGLVAAGIALGAAGAYWFARLIARFLFATPPTDPVAYGLVALVLVGAALIATIGPAIRATTVDPYTALKD